MWTGQNFIASPLLSEMQKPLLVIIITKKFHFPFGKRAIKELTIEVELFEALHELLKLLGVIRLITGVYYDIIKIHNAEIVKEEKKDLVH